MKLSGPLLTIFAAICIVAAGCSGGNVQTLPSAPTAAAPNAVLNAGSSANALASSGCRRAGCPAHVVAPLAFDGKAFSIAKHLVCKNVGLGTAKGYKAPASGRFMLKGNVILPPTCVPKGTLPTTRLFIAATWAGAAHRNAADAIDVSDGKGKTAHLTALGGPATWKGSEWTFLPMGLGIGVRAHVKYEFYIVSVPMDATAAGNFVLLQPLSFDGANFSVVANSCFNGDPEDAPPYAAPTSGPLTLAGSVTIAPTCVPSPLPSFSPLPQLFIVAVDLSATGDARRAQAAHRAHTHSNALQPMDDGFGVAAVAIAGGVNITDNPWVFAPDSPGLTMTAGTNYGFFIAAELPPPPPPTQQYQEVVPLGFDGTTFTIPSIANCAQLPAAVPFTASATGPLTLAGNVSLTPTCIPSSSSSSSSSSSATGQLYIVATTPCNATGGYGGGDSRRSHDYGGGCQGGDGGGVYGGDDSSGGCSSSSSSCCSSSSSGSSSSSTCCQNSSSSSGDNARRSHDGGGSGSGNGCQINGFAIAGPVNATDNPWSFAPITPALVLTGGQQYSFYIGMSTGEGDGGGSGSGSGNGGDGSGR